MRWLVTSLCFLLFACSKGEHSPRTYDECMLDKMKGKSPSMTYYAEEVCEVAFPYEKPLLGYDLSKLKLSWDVSADAITLHITKNMGNYEIRRITAEFSEFDCGMIIPTEILVEHSMSKMFPFRPGELSSTVPLGKGPTKDPDVSAGNGEQNTTIANLEAPKYRCMNVQSLTGARRKAR